MEVKILTDKYNPTFHLRLEGKAFPVKHVFTDKSVMVLVDSHGYKEKPQTYVLVLNKGEFEEVRDARNISRV